MQGPVEGQVVPGHSGQQYVIGRFIDQGNFGAVYECSDEWGNDLVAKVAHNRFSNEADLENHVLREMKVLHAARNPFITYIYDTFRHDGRWYIIVERCAFTIRQLVSFRDYNGPVLAKPIAKCILQALHFLHAGSILHRDIHLDNLFAAIERDNLAGQSFRVTFKLGDLGVADRIGNPNPLFRFNPKIEPPESLNPSEFGPIDQRADVYQAGTVFLQLLLNHFEPFTEVERLAGIPGQLARDLGGPWGTGLEKALRRHVHARTGSALQLWRDLKDAP